MQFLVISRRLTEKFSDAEFEPIVPLEGARARYLHSIGFTRQIWHRADQPGACQVVEAESLDEAKGHLSTLPLAGAGMIEFEIIPLIPYAGFNREVSS
ncbi:muconolactone Delta-isomerase family protein [Rhizobium giardinii]|uniref:muconolactone Delta-isomerase family protein n=1 Tax=Rhizobium giardinii TaxID=56731 RepID=UPI003D6E2F46